MSGTRYDVSSDNNCFCTSESHLKFFAFECLFLAIFKKLFETTQQTPIYDNFKRKCSKFQSTLILNVTAFKCSEETFFWCLKRQLEIPHKKERTVLAQS